MVDGGMIDYDGRSSTFDDRVGPPHPSPRPISATPVHAPRPSHLWHVPPRCTAPIGRGGERANEVRRGVAGGISRSARARQVAAVAPSSYAAPEASLRSVAICLNGTGSRAGCRSTRWGQRPENGLRRGMGWGEVKGARSGLTEVTAMSRRVAWYPLLSSLCQLFPTYVFPALCPIVPVLLICSGVLAFGGVSAVWDRCGKPLAPSIHNGHCDVYDCSLSLERGACADHR